MTLMPMLKLQLTAMVKQVGREPHHQPTLQLCRPLLLQLSRHPAVSTVSTLPRFLPTQRVTARPLRWLQQRVSAAGMAIDNEALQLLCDRVEGNLLAAVQEVEKLKLLAEGGQINDGTVTATASNNARYNLIDMNDRALKGNAAGSLKMLHGLRGEGTEPAVALWALLREIRTLHQAQQAVDSGQNPQQALSSLRVWKNRMSLMQGALGRHSRNSLNRLLEQATAVDGSIKGFAGGKPWDNLETLILDLAGARR